MAQARAFTCETMSFHAEEESAVPVVAFGKAPQVAAANAPAKANAARETVKPRAMRKPLARSLEISRFMNSLLLIESFDIQVAPIVSLQGSVGFRANIAYVVRIPCLKLYGVASCW